MVKVSVILTTYNGENTLRRAVDSWLAQTLADCEIVITDDCSKDDTRSIIAEYAKQYPERIVANYMEHNTRNSGAINYGVETAHGKYVIIVDQDDWADKTMLEKLYNVAERENAEIADCNCAVIDSAGNLLEIQKSYTPDQIGDITVEKRKSLLVYPGWRFTKIIRKDFLVKNNLEHCRNTCFGDSYIMEFIAAYCTKIAKVDEPLYFYYIDTSVSQTMNNPIIYDRVKSAELMIEGMKERGFLELYREEIEFRFIELFYANSISAFLQRFRPCELNEIRYLRNTVKQKYSNYRKNKYFKENLSKKKKVLTLLCDICPTLLCKTYPLYAEFKKIFQRNR